MIFIDWAYMKGDVAALVKRFDALPKHIAKKHILASMKRAIRKTGGVQKLKANTPKGKAYFVASGVGRDSRGRFAPKLKRQPAGALRRSVTVKAKYRGTNASGMAVATLGYKYGAESKKAIWLEFGTRTGIEPRRMVARTMSQIASAVRHQLCYELHNALMVAPKELGYNPARLYLKGGSWIPE